MNIIYCMNNDKLLAMSFSRVYPLYIAKAQKKGRTKEEVDQIIFWLFGYSKPELDKHIEMNTSFIDFIRLAPELHPNRELIKGVICGIRVEDIEDSNIRIIRYLDKLIDELAKGKTMEKILRK